MPLKKDNALQFYGVGQNTSEWDRILQDCEHFHRNTKAISLLRSGLDEKVRVVALERSYICKDHRNLHSSFLSKKFHDRPSHCSRLHFFDHDDIDRDVLFSSPDRAQEHYLGYSVIRPMPGSEIGRTIIDAEKLGFTHAGGAYYLRTRFRVNLNGVDLYLMGFPFMPQDSEATCCSHAALWGICRYLSQRYSEYKEFLPYDLVLRTSPERGRIIPYRGMTHSDYSRILVDFGCHPVSFKTKVGDESFLDLCTYVESGIPVVASLINSSDGPGHVVNLIGHTSNKDQFSKRTGFHRQVPTADDAILEVTESSAFLDAFIVIDDNLFPYRHLGFKDFGKTDERLKSKRYFIDTIHTVVAPLPEKVYLGASLARKVAYSLLKELASDDTVSAYFQNSDKDELVVRLFFTTSRAFKTKKLEMSKKFENSGLLTYPLEKHLPHFVWVMEVARRSTFFDDPSKRCFAEIVLDATSNEFEDCFVYARVANFVAERLEDRATWAVLKDSPCHFPQFHHNLGHEEPQRHDPTRYVPHGRNA